MRMELPVFQILRRQDLAGQLEDNLIFFFGLSGSCDIITREKTYTLKKADMLVMNPYEVYRMQSSVDAAVIRLRVSQKALAYVGWNSACNCFLQVSDEEHSIDRHMKELLAKSVQAYIERPRPETIEKSADLRELMELLKTHFRAGAQSNRTDAERLMRIVQTIQEHYQEEISLAGLAEREYLSVGYLSRYIRKNLGMSFSQYVRELRLVQARQMLTFDSETITHISYDCGFHSPSAFIEEFRQQYGITPGQYRQQLVDQETQGGQESNLRSEAVNDIGVLLAYIPAEAELEQIEESLVLHVDSSKNRRQWNSDRILNIGYARDLLQAPIQQQILRAQKEIGFTYLRFHGLLDEDMHIYWEDQNGNPQFTFHYLDLVFDFLVSAGLRAYVELSFMPKEIAREDTRIFDRASVISGCTDLKKWKHLIKAVVIHLEERYSKEIVRTWRFTTISQSYVHLNCVAWEDYQNLYEAAFHAVRETDEALLFGGPGCFAELIGEENGIPAFLKFVQEKNCRPDFISFQFNPHVHTYDPLFMDFTISQQSSPAILSEDPDYLKHSLDQLERLLGEYGYAKTEIFIEEGTSTLWQRDLSGDTCYKASWLCKNLSDSFGRAHFGYWLLTDLLEERAKIESVFHGGYGLMTYNGIPKAGYYAMTLLGKAGPKLVDKGPGWMLTESEGGYQLLLYHFCYYSNMYRYRYQKLSEPKDAYSVFEKGGIRRIRIHMEGMCAGSYRVERTGINREHGSSFDSWVKLGAPAYPDAAEVQYLSAECEPERHLYKETVEDSVSLESILEPHSVELIMFTKI